MKREFTLDIDGQQVTVAAERDGDTIRVSREDAAFTVRILAESVPGVQSGARQPTGSGAPQASAPISRAPARKPTPASKPAAPVAGDSGTVTSPMTGVIDQVLVQEGAAVTEGQTIIVLEAMKMYIDVMAPAAGTVASVSVRPGARVQEGQTLLSIDVTGGAG